MLKPDPNDPAIGWYVIIRSATVTNSGHVESVSDNWIVLTHVTVDDPYVHRNEDDEVEEKGTILRILVSRGGIIDIQTPPKEIH